MLLEAKELNKKYRVGEKVIRAAEDVSLTVDSGEFVAVRGPSGCGKTTLLLMAGGLMAPDSGTVRVLDQDPYVLKPDARARFRAQNIGFVFQQFHLVPYLHVLDNVLAPALAANLPDAKQRAMHLLERFGLTDRLHHVPSELSTGERQRTALSRALLLEPKLLLADEPTGNLDRENADLVLNCLSEFAQQGGGVLLVTHDQHAAEAAHRTAQITQGKLTAV